MLLAVVLRQQHVTALAEQCRSCCCTRLPSVSVYSTVTVGNEYLVYMLLCRHVGIQHNTNYVWLISRVSIAIDTIWDHHVEYTDDHIQGCVHLGVAQLTCRIRHSRMSNLTCQVDIQGCLLLHDMDTQSTTMSSHGWLKSIDLHDVCSGTHLRRSRVRRLATDITIAGLSW